MVVSRYKTACALGFGKGLGVKNGSRYITTIMTNWREIPAGSFLMGCENSPYPEDGEGPVRQVTLDAFSMAACAVTNAEFAAFVNATGYVTDAERKGYSFVFLPEADDQGFERLAHAAWWAEVPEVCWNNPINDGLVDYLTSTPDSSNSERDLPVVHVSRNDALAYCAWAAYRLPTEAEWEYAARGGLESKHFPWGDELEPDGVHRSNVWQGEFPNTNTAEDGYTGLSPALSFPANGYGLYNMTGNVWEWCADRHTRLHGPKPMNNPKGPLSGSQYVMKGGSFLCHASYCMRYRVAARTCNLPDATASNIGFRVMEN
jgi:formylglycine-generating enzyme required for sulfatase activity